MKWFKKQKRYAKRINELVQENNTLQKEVKRLKQQLTHMVFDDEEQVPSGLEVTPVLNAAEE